MITGCLCNISVDSSVQRGVGGALLGNRSQ
jgi:hypothetical protein